MLEKSECISVVKTKHLQKNYNLLSSFYMYKVSSIFNHFYIMALCVFAFYKILVRFNFISWKKRKSFLNKKKNPPFANS